MSILVLPGYENFQDEMGVLPEERIRELVLIANQPLPEDKLQKAQCQEAKIKARNEIVMHNQRLVFSVARAYSERSGVELTELVNEGNLGLIHAIGKFKVELGNKFSTYVTYWIKQRIRLAIRSDHMIHVPHYLFKQVRLYKEFLEQFQIQHRRKPTPREVSVGLAAQPSRVRLVMHGERAFHRTRDDETLYRLPWPERENESYPELALVKKVLASMEKSRKPRVRRAAEVISLRHIAPGMTLAEVGRLFNVTKERVRQIENFGMRFLRIKVERLLYANCNT